MLTHEELTEAGIELSATEYHTYFPLLQQVYPDLSKDDLCLHFLLLTDYRSFLQTQWQRYIEYTIAAQRYAQQHKVAMAAYAAASKENDSAVTLSIHARMLADTYCIDAKAAQKQMEAQSATY